MSTVATIIDRINRDWVNPPSSQHPVFVMNDSGGISSSDTTVITETSYLSPEEEDRIGVGRLIQIGSEWLRITAVSGTSPDLTLTVTRGHLGTTAAAHADASEIYLPGEGFISRLSIFEAVADAIDTLWPDLYGLTYEESGSSGEPIEIPADVGEVVDVITEGSGRWYQVGSWTEFQNWPYTATGKALQLEGVAAGHDIVIVYKQIPTRPTAESDTWAALNVDAAWVRVITLSAVAELMARYDLESFDTQFITESLEAEGQAPGEGSDIRNSILQLRDFLMRPLMRQLVRKQNDRLLVDKSY